MTMPGQDGGGNASSTRDATVNLNANVSGYVSSMAAAETQTNRTAGALDRFDAKLQNVQKTASRGLVHFSEADFAVLGGATADAATLEKQLGTLRAANVVTGASFRGTKADIENAFQKLPESRTQIIALAESISNLGVTGTKDLGSLIVTFAKLGEASGEGPTQLAQGLIQLSRLMGQTNATQIGNYANAVLTVSKNSGVSVTGVLSFAQAIAPMARQAGIGEAAVLGISAAFSKAGADGYVAANTFNSIVSDITQLTQSGSPELSKYANLIGVTVGQFKSMDKTTALQDIFNTISKQGPQAINTLNRLGIDGVRAQSAISAVVQSGGLDQAISTAQGASGNQNNLNKGAAAATADLADDLAKVRNELTQIGTEIGSTFLKPVEAGVNALDKVLSVVQAITHEFSALFAITGAFGGALSAVVGTALHLGGVIGAAALVRTVTRGGPSAALRQGISAARPVLGETAEQTAARMAANPSAVMYARHVSGEATMPLRARIPFIAGQGIGRLMPPVDPNAPPSTGPGIGRQLVRGAVRAPFQLVGALTRNQSSFMADAARDDFARSPYNSAMGRPAAGGAGGFRASLSNQLALNRASLQTQSTFGALRAGTGTVIKAFADLGVQTARTAVSIVSMGHIGGSRVDTGRVRQPGAIRSVAGAAAGGIAGGVRSIAGALGPVGAALIAAPLAMSLVDKVKASSAKPYQVDDSLNQFQKYDDALGTSATNVARFGDAVSSATSTLNDVSGKSLSQVSKVTGADVQTATSGYKPADSSFAALAKNHPKDISAATAYIQAGVTRYAGGAMDPKDLQGIKTDLIAAYGPQQAQAILNQLMGSGSTPNYTALGTAARGNSMGTFKDVVGQGITGITSQAQVAPGKQSSRAEIGALVQLGGSALTGTQQGSKTPESLTSYLQKVLGGKASDYYLPDSSTLGPNASGSAFTKAYGTTQASQQAVLRAITGSPQGKKFLANAGIDVSTIKTPADAQKLLTQLTNTQFAAAPQSETAKRVSASGLLGTYAERSSTVQTAYNAPDNPALQYSGMQGLYQQAGGLSSTGSAESADAALDKLTGTINDTSDQLYIMARAAKAYAQQQESYAQPFQNRQTQLLTSAGNYKEAFQANQKSPTADTYGDLQSAQANYEQQLQAQQQFEIQAQQQAKAFGVQMTRAQEDENTQVSRANRDFRIQEQQSQQDFDTQEYRQARDHAVQLKQQAASTAQTIYDPYNRVQAKYTIGASNLESNLVDENTRLKLQKQELTALSAAGLSTSAIQTLNLSDPSNAQQLDSLYQQAAQDPSIISKLNAATATRMTLTKSLTQNDFNLTYQQSQQNFSQGIKDAGNDYDLQRERAVEAQARSLGDMSTDFNKMVKRSAQDLTTSMTEIYGTYAQQYGKTLSTINADIGKYAPGLAKTLTGEITAMNTTINNVTGLGLDGTPSAGLSSAAVIPASPQPVRGKVIGHAMGAISVTAHRADISEGNKPEMILPLDQRGQQFLGGMYEAISRSLLTQMQGRQFGAAATGSGSAPAAQQVDSSTNFNGPISITADNTDSIIAELDKKKRLKKLSSPVRH